MIWLIAAIAVLGLGVVLFSALYVADALTGSRRIRVQGLPADLGVRYEDIQFLAADRLTLRGWYMPVPSATAAVVVIHEAGATRADRERALLQLHRDYVTRGFTVFAFDLRAHGESGGKRDSFGAKERLDVQAAVAYVGRRSPRTPVILHGFGYGATLAIDAAARGVEAAAVIADSPFSSARAFIQATHQHLPRLHLRLAFVLARRLLGADIDALRPYRAVQKVGVPLLFIHAEGDAVVPVTESLNLAAASLNPRVQTWTVPDALGHGTVYREQPDEYLDRCVAFIEESVPARLRPPAGTGRAARAG